MPDDPKKGLALDPEKALSSGDDLLDLVPSIISIQDREFRIRRVNRAFRSLFGDRVGQHCYEVYKGRTEVCLNCPMAETFRDGQTHRSEEVVRTDDGAMIQMAVETTPLTDEHGKIIGGMEVATDISRTVASQQEMVLLGQAMATMAHYIKNIVTGLEGGIFVVEEGLANDEDALLHKGWEMVRRNIARITKLSRDQLFCARERLPEMREVSPNALVGEAVRLYRERAAQFDVELSVDLDPRLESAVLDPDEYHDLLTNLLSNAIDACAFDTGKSRHWISVKTFLESGGDFVIEVADNGHGIPKDICSDVFTEMFTSKGLAGTGLGLLVVYRVVSAHGGQIAVLSEEEVGTVFTVILPLNHRGVPATRPVSTA